MQAQTITLNSREGSQCHFLNKSVYSYQNNKVERNENCYGRDNPVKCNRQQSHPHGRLKAGIQMHNAQCKHQTVCIAQNIPLDYKDDIF